LRWEKQENNRNANENMLKKLDFSFPYEGYKEELVENNAKRIITSHVCQNQLRKKQAMSIS